MNITGPAIADDTITPPPQPVTTTTTGPAQEPPRARIFSALDHYNAAAEALQQISLHHEDEDFGIADATVLIQIAQTHGLLGQLKLSLDTAK